jgi:hypothetical protein
MLPRVWSGNSAWHTQDLRTLGRGERLLNIGPPGRGHATLKLSNLPVSLLLDGAGVVVFLLEEADQAAALRGMGNEPDVIAATVMLPDFRASPKLLKGTEVAGY